MATPKAQGVEESLSLDGGQLNGRLAEGHPKSPVCVGGFDGNWPLVAVHLSRVPAVSDSDKACTR